MNLKAEGLDRVEGSNTTWVRLLREKAIEIALREGEVFIDDVRQWAQEQGYSAEMFCEKCTEGFCGRVHKNAWGAVFRGAGWRWTGAYRKSVFGTNHSHESKVWQYNSAATPQLRAPEPLGEYSSPSADDWQEIFDCLDSHDPSGNGPSAVTLLRDLHFEIVRRA